MFAPTVAAAFLLIALVGCPPKVAPTLPASRPSLTLLAPDVRAVVVALDVALKTEKALCYQYPLVEQGDHCTNPVAATVQWSDRQHVLFAQAMVRVWTALRHRSYDELTAAAHDALVTAQTVQSGSPSGWLVSDVQKLVDAIAALHRQVR